MNRQIHGCLQLGHVNRIGFLCTSCDVSNLAGNVLRSISDGNSSGCRFPSGRVHCWWLFRSRIIADGIFINRSIVNRSNRSGTKGYALVYLCISIMSNHDGIFEVFSMFYWCFSCYFFCPSESEQIMHDCFCLFRRIHRTDDDVIIATIQLVVITNHNGFVWISNGILVANRINTRRIIDMALNTIEHIELCRIFFCPGNAAAYTNNLAALCIIRFITTANNQSSATSISIGHAIANILRCSCYICTCWSTHRNICDRILDFVTST